MITTKLAVNFAINNIDPNWAVAVASECNLIN